jgi:hypothetical protein
MISSFYGALHLLLLFPALVGATTILSVRTPTDIYVGADSKITIIRPDGSAFYAADCKILQAGKTFFAAAGPYGAPGLNVWSSFLESASLGGSVYQIATRFGERYATAMARNSQTVLMSSPSQHERLIRTPVNAYFFAFEGSTPVFLHKQFIYQTQGPGGDTTVRMLEFDCPPGCTEPHVVGIGHGDTFKTLSPASLGTKSPVDFIREQMEWGIKNDPTYSGPPVDILRLTKDGAKWIQKKPQCAEIKPYSD